MKLQVFHQIDELLPSTNNLPLDDLFAVALLLYFGINTLKVWRIKTFLHHTLSCISVHTGYFMLGFSHRLPCGDLFAMAAAAAALLWDQYTEGMACDRHTVTDCSVNNNI